MSSLRCQTRENTLISLVCSPLSAVPVTMTLLTVGLSPVQAAEQTIHERMFHSRAIEAVVWAMPLLNFKGFRDGHASVGVGYNDIAYTVCTTSCSNVGGKAGWGCCAVSVAGTVAPGALSGWVLCVAASAPRTAPGEQTISIAVITITVE